MRLGIFISSFVFLLAVAFGQDPMSPREPGKPGGYKLYDKKEKEPDSSRSVQGKVFDPGDDAVKGAVVQLKDVKTLRVRSYITLEDGSYQFHGLNTDTDYELKATHEGRESRTRRLSVYDSRKKATIDLKLEPKG
jgi:hypothetical protein